MGRVKGTFNFSANFEPKFQGPFDARMLVDEFADLIDPSIWVDSDNFNVLYTGAIVAVPNDPSVVLNGVYYLRDFDNFTYASSWVHIASSEAVNIKSFETTIIGNDASTSFEIVHNINSLSHTITVYDSSTNEEIIPGKVRGNNIDHINFYTPPDSATNYNIVIMGF